MSMGLGLGFGLGSGGGLTSRIYIYLMDPDGSRLTDADGFYLRELL
jgi:hypothetical protein